MVKNNLFNRYSFLKIGLILSVFQVLISCDTIAPPMMINGYTKNVNVQIMNSNNTQVECLLESNELLVSRTKGLRLIYLKIYNENMELIAEYDSKYIDKKRADLVDNEYWVVTEKDLYIVPRKNYFDGKWQEYIKSKPQ